jgi:hypothetical protein
MMEEDKDEKKWSVPWFDCDLSLTWQGLNLNSRHFGSITFISVSLENCVCLSRCVQVAGACSDKDHGRS